MTITAVLVSKRAKSIEIPLEITECGGCNNELSLSSSPSSSLLSSFSSTWKKKIIFDKRKICVNFTAKESNLTQVIFYGLSTFSNIEFYLRIILSSIKWLIGLNMSNFWSVTLWVWISYLNFAFGLVFKFIMFLNKAQTVTVWNSELPVELSTSLGKIDILSN